MTPSSEAAGVPFNTDGTIHMQDLGYWFGCPPGMRIDKFLEHVRTKYRADGEGAVAWPTRRANVPYRGSETTRLVGFVIEKGDEAFGEYGLSEPLAWLDRMCAAHPAPVAAQPAEGWVLVPREPTEDMFIGKGQNGSTFEGYMPFRDFVWCWRTALASSPTPPTAPAVVREALLDDVWQRLLDKDDRTSPAEYPDMVLITREEVAAIMVATKAALSALPAQPNSSEGEPTNG